MKTNLLKYYIAAFYFCSTFVLFAQPSDGSDGAPLEGDEPAAPIDGYVWVLTAIGLVYVFLRLRAYHKQANN